MRHDWWKHSVRLLLRIGEVQEISLEKLVPYLARYSLREK